MNLPLTLVLYCVAILAESVMGGLLPLFVRLSHTRMHLFLSFASGVMLGAVFFHMLPEAVELGGAEVLKWACVGLLALFFLERYFAFHQHASPEFTHHAHSDHNHGPAAKGKNLHWGIAAAGLAIHTLVGGFALASAAASASTQLGASFGVFLATLMHKPADSLTIVSLMLRSGSSRVATQFVNLAFSLLVPVGVGSFFLFREWLAAGSPAVYTAAALAFSAGTFLCIALSDLLPELQFHEHDRLALSISLLLGTGLMALSGLWG